MTKLSQIINLSKGIDGYRFYLLNNNELNNITKIVLKPKQLKKGCLKEIEINLDRHSSLNDLYNDKESERPTHYYLNNRISGVFANTLLYLDNVTNLELKGFYFYQDKETGRKYMDFNFSYKEEK